MTCSLLNGAAIDAGGAYSPGFSGRPGRDLVVAAARAILTLTSLRGVPYRTTLGPTLGQAYVDHADYARFAFVYPGETLAEPRPDEQVLCFGAKRVAQAIGWAEFSEFAKATSAFPVGFPARALSRRPATTAGGWCPTRPDRPTPTHIGRSARTGDAMIPSGASDVPEDWQFLSVDGVRRTTSRSSLPAPRWPACWATTRATPRRPTGGVADPPIRGACRLGPAGLTPFPSELGAIITTLTQQTRYGTADILMATDETVFSRYMLSPVRAGLTGRTRSPAAGSAHSSASACPDFMRFDYLLGRATARTTSATSSYC